MTSEARIQANRRNAEKSTGPKTEAGKERVRLNALKHGLAAETVVLPHEDAAAFARRCEAWARELSPGGEVGGYMAERAARISWQLDRADAAEHAVLAKRVREVPRERERSRRRRAAEQVRTILTADPMPPADRPRRTRADRLDRLESTAHGCRALLEAWAALEGRLSGPGGGDVDAVGEQVVRLLGAADLPGAARSSDPRLRRVADALAEDRHRMFGPLLAAFKKPYEEIRESDLAISPPDHTAARTALLEVIAGEQGRLRGLLEAREAEEPDLAAEDAARVAFDTSKGAEVVHRYQGQWGRALIQTLKAIAALRPAVAAEPSRETVDEAVVESAPMPDQADPAVAPEQSQRDGNKSNGEEDLWQASGRRSRRRPGPRPASRTVSVGLPSRRPARRRWAGEPSNRDLALAS